MASGMQMTLEEYMPEICPKQTVGASDFLAKTYQSAESNKGFTETVQASFSELLDFFKTSKKKIDLNGCSLKMLKICTLFMEDGILPESSLNWNGVGTMHNGKLSIQPITECHKTERGSILLDILEEEVDEKYFLSPGTQIKLLRRQTK